MVYIEINGNSGDFLGSEMTGGKIIVYIDAGNFVLTDFCENASSYAKPKFLGKVRSIILNFIRWRMTLYY